MSNQPIPPPPPHSDDPHLPFTLRVEVPQAPGSPAGLAPVSLSGPQVQDQSQAQPTVWSNPSPARGKMVVLT